MSIATDLNDAERMEDARHDSSVAVPTGNLDMTKNSTDVLAKAVHDDRQAADARDNSVEEQGNEKLNVRKDHAKENEGEPC